MATIRQLLGKAGNGAKSLGEAVHAAARGAMPQPKPAAVPMDGPAQMLDSAPAMAQFTLPDLGPKPDLNDPKYSGDDVPAGQYESDLNDWQHKQDIHNAFSELDRIYQEAHPQRDFKGEYEQELAALGKDPGFAPEGSMLKRFALALGDFNPAVQQTGKSNLSEADNRQNQYDEKKRDLLRRMTEKKAAEAEQRGNFSTALKQQEALQLMDYDKERRTQADRMALETQKEASLKERAQIRAEAQKSAAQIVASHRYPGRGQEALRDKLAEKLVGQYAERFGNTSITAEPGLDMHALVDAMSELDAALNPDHVTEAPPKSSYHVGGAPRGVTTPLVPRVEPTAEPAPTKKKPRF